VNTGLQTTVGSFLLVLSCHSSPKESCRQMMWIILSPILPAGVVLAGLAMLEIFFAMHRGRDWRHPRRSPLTRNMLRPPGFSLQAKIRDVDARIISCIGGFLIAPIAVYAIHISQSYFANMEESGLRITTSFITAIAIVGVVGWRLFHLLGPSSCRYSAGGAAFVSCFPARNWLAPVSGRFHVR